MIKAKIYLELEVTFPDGAADHYRFFKYTRIPAILPVDSIIFLKGDEGENHISEIDCRITGYQWFEEDEEIHIETEATNAIVMEENSDKEIVEWMSEMIKCGWQEE